MSLTFKIFVALAAFYFGSSSFAQFDFLRCSSEKIENYKASCADLRCTNCDKQLNKTCKSCIETRARSCYCLTFIGARFFNNVPFDFKRFSIHGNFCGWRNAAVFWTNLALPTYEEKLHGTEAMSAVDFLDEICKKHDIAYVRKPIDICLADQSTIDELSFFAYVYKSTSENAEKAIVLRESLKMNDLSCHFLSWYLN